jgi:hypothetical protein
MRRWFMRSFRKGANAFLSWPDSVKITSGVQSRSKTEYEFVPLQPPFGIKMWLFKHIATEPRIAAYSTRPPTYASGRK